MAAAGVAFLVLPFASQFSVWSLVPSYFPLVGKATSESPCSSQLAATASRENICFVSFLVAFGSPHQLVGGGGL